MELSAMGEAIRATLSGLPLLSKALNWMAARGLSIEIVPSSYTSCWINEVGTVLAYIRLRVINYRTDRDEHVVGGKVVVRRPKWKGMRWEPVAVARVHLRAHPPPLDVVLPRQSSWVTLDLEADRQGGDMSLPEDATFAFFLLLEFSGPIRKIERQIPLPQAPVIGAGEDAELAAKDSGTWLKARWSQR